MRFTRLRRALSSSYSDLFRPSATNLFTFSESLFTIRGIRVHDTLEWLFTFGRNLRSRCPGIRIWALMLALLPTVMLVGDSGGGRLKWLQSASLLVSMPLIINYVVVGFALAKSLRENEQNKIGQSEAG